MIYKRLGSTALLLAFLAVPASASMVSLLLVETGLGEETNSSPYSSLWEGGLMEAFFNAGYIVTNSPVSRMAKNAGGDADAFVKDDFDEAVSGGADFFILGFLDFQVRGERGVPVGIVVRIFSAGSRKMIYEQRFPAGAGKNLDEEYKNAQDAGKFIISHLKDR